VRALDIPAADFADLAGVYGLETAKGDIRDSDFLRAVVEGCQWVVHLAAILPPVSEYEPDLTVSVNQGGTQNLLDALEATGGNAPLVFASTVTVYGDTSSETPPVTVRHPLRPCEVYGESKARAEALLQKRGYPSTVLRIGGVVIPALQEPPEPWPFFPEQRIEFINRDDAALAVVHCVDNTTARGQIFNVAGGESWQLHGRRYVQDYYDTYGIPFEEASFAGRIGSYDWYDTVESQRILDYQRTSYPRFLTLLREIVGQALGN